MLTSSQTRRTFLQASASVALAACSGSVPKNPQGTPKAGEIKLPEGATMPMRDLGSTGVKVSIVGLGGYHIGIPKEDAVGIRIIHMALDHGVNFLDNCWDYNGGKSEERMGKALAEGGYRKKAFLMTKLDGRTKEAANGQLEQSLKRLQTDVIDLVQIHEVIRMEDAARVFAAGGAMEALLAAKQAGKIRFIGFTGHKDPSIHLNMLKAADEHGFKFDTVQMPLNVMDAHYHSFEKQVVPVLVEKKIGVLGMKSLGSSMILDSGVVSATECLHYAMNLPTSVVITGCESIGVLEQALAAAYDFKPLPEPEVTALLARTQEAASEGKFEKFKTTQIFDGTTSNPKWLEKAEV